MIEAFQEQRTLTGELVRLVPLGPEHFEDEWAMLQDEETRRLTGTHATFTEEQIRGVAGEGAAGGRPRRLGHPPSP